MYEDRINIILIMSLQQGIALDMGHAHIFSLLPNS